MSAPAVLNDSFGAGVLSLKGRYRKLPVVRPERPVSGSASDRCRPRAALPVRRPETYKADVPPRRLLVLSGEVLFPLTQPYRLSRAAVREGPYGARLSFLWLLCLKHRDA